jgi:trigger factor
MVTNCRREKLSPEEEDWICTFWKGLRFQLIEGRAMAQSDIKITLKTWKRSLQKHQNTNGTIRTNKPTDEEVQGIVARVLSNQDEVKKLSDQVVAEKLLELFKEKQIQQLKKLLMTNLLLVLRRINSKNWLYLSVKRKLLALFILINLRS